MIGLSGQDMDLFGQWLQALQGQASLAAVVQTAIEQGRSIWQLDDLSIVLLGQDGEVDFLIASNEQGGLNNVVLLRSLHPELTTVISQQSMVLLDLAALRADKTQQERVWPSLRPNCTHLALFPLKRQEKVVGAVVLFGSSLMLPPQARLETLGVLLATAIALALNSSLENDRLLHRERELLRIREADRRQLLTLQQYANAFENAPDGILLLDREGQILYGNPAAATMLHISSEQMGQSNLLKLLHLRSQGILRQAMAIPLAASAVDTSYLDLWLESSSGARNVLSASIRPLVEGGGILVTFRDVTTLRLLEQESLQTKQLLQNVVQSSVSGILAFDQFGNLILLNKAAAAILDWQGEATLWQQLAMEQLFPPDACLTIVGWLRAQEQTDGKPAPRMERIRTYLLNRGGDQIPVEMSGSVLQKDGAAAGWVGIFNDLRLQLKSERQFEKMQQALQRSERQVVAMELAGAAAHELNQPLTAILGYSNLLLHKMTLPESAQQSLQIIQQETERMAEIVRKIGQMTAYETKNYVGNATILAFANEPPAAAGGSAPSPADTTKPKS